MLPLHAAYAGGFSEDDVVLHLCLAGGLSNADI